MTQQAKKMLSKELTLICQNKQLGLQFQLKELLGEMAQVIQIRKSKFNFSHRSQLEVPTIEELNIKQCFDNSSEISRFTYESQSPC